jgi:hypothetical protein
VTEAKLASNSVTTLKIANDAVTTAKIADSNVTTAKINALAVTTAKIDALAVTTAKLDALAVTTAKITDDAVTAAKLADDASVDANRAVTTDHIRDSAVTTAKINDGAVTGPKLSTRYALATVSTDANWTNGETKTLSNITTSGRSVRVMIYQGLFSITVAGGIHYNIDLQHSPDNSIWSTVDTFLDIFNATGVIYFGGPATPVLNYDDVSGPAISVHTPAAGTSYYRLKMTFVSGSGGTFAITDSLKVLIEEL